MTESPHDFETLTKFLHYLPYRSLRQRLATELERTERRTIHAHLREALAALPPAKLSAAELEERRKKRDR